MRIIKSRVKLLKNKIQIFVTLVFLGFVIWWATFQHVVAQLGLSVQRFGYTYGILAFLGAIIGFWASRKWGGHKTVLGKAILFFSLGLLAQEAGQLITTYYVVVAKINIPYPSWGDVAYFGSTFSYICGGVFLTKAVGVKYALKSNKYKAIAVIVPVVLLAASYWVFLHHHQYDWHHPLTVFLDLGYPLGDAIYISLALLSYFLSRKLLGGVMRSAILIMIVALFAQYISDWTFLYQSNRGTYVPGKYDDLFYLITYFITSTAIIKFLSVYKGLQGKNGDKTPVVATTDKSEA
jgi:hypothetical protein